MAAFDYKALDERGKKVSGVIEADSARLVRQMLRDKGLFPQEIEQAKEKRSGSGEGFFNFSPSLAVTDLSLLTRQLSTLIGSGMPLEESLRALAEQSEKKKIRSMVMAIRSKVLEGYTLADSLAEFKRAFPPLYRATVAAGEKSGNLDVVLNKLADYVEDQSETLRKVKQGATYPVILMLVSVGVIVTVGVLVGVAVKVGVDVEVGEGVEMGVDNGRSATPVGAISA